MKDPYLSIQTNILKYSAFPLLSIENLRRREYVFKIFLDDVSASTIHFQGHEQKVNYQIQAL